MSTAARFVGQSVKRREDPRLLSGHGRYADDVSLPGQLHVAFLRSDVPAGTIRGIDTSAAKEVPGVQAVLTAPELGEAMAPNQPAMPLPFLPLAADEVCFAGDPIAMVVASSRYVAEDALELIEVDIEPREAVSTFDEHEGRRGAARARDRRHERDPATDGEADLDTTFADAATRLGSDLRHDPRHQRADGESRARRRVRPLLPGPADLAVHAEPPRAEGVHGARVLGIPASRVRIEFGDVGGGFGQKMYPDRGRRARCCTAKIVGRPVKWIEDRRET